MWILCQLKQQPCTCTCSMCIVYMYMFRPYAWLSFIVNFLWRPSSWWKATESTGNILGWHQVVPCLGLLQNFHVRELPVLLSSQWLILPCCSWEYKQPSRPTNQVKYMYMVVDNPTTNELINLPISFSQFPAVVYVYFTIDEPWLSCPHLFDGSSSKINSCCCGSSPCLYWEGKPTLGQTIKSILSHTWIPSSSS